MSNSILVVDDSRIDLELVSLACKKIDCVVQSVNNPEDALELYKKKRHSVVLTDYMMEPMTGLDLISKIKDFDGEATCLIMTGFPGTSVNQFILSNELAPAIRKPINPLHLAEQLRVAFHGQRGAMHSLNRIAISNRMDQCVALLGHSQGIRTVCHQIAELSMEHKLIFLEGPFGVGKPDVAEFIHKTSAYGESRLVICDCREISSVEMAEMIISEEGIPGTSIREAECGTLVLNNVDHIPQALQRQLALHLSTLSKSCQIIAWANASMDELLEAGTIADELYFELSLNRIYLPPLNERPVDIEEIVRFVAKSPEAFGLHRKLTSTEVDWLVASLRRTELKGNLRELIQRIRRATQVGDPDIAPEAFCH